MRLFYRLIISHTNIFFLHKYLMSSIYYSLSIIKIKFHFVIYSIHEVLIDTLFFVFDRL